MEPEWRIGVCLLVSQDLRQFLCGEECRSQVQIFRIGSMSWEPVGEVWHWAEAVANTITPAGRGLPSPMSLAGCSVHLSIPVAPSTVPAHWAVLAPRALQSVVLGERPICAAGVHLNIGGLTGTGFGIHYKIQGAALVFTGGYHQGGEWFCRDFSGCRKCYRWVM